MSMLWESQNSLRGRFSESHYLQMQRSRYGISGCKNCGDPEISQARMDIISWMSQSQKEGLITNSVGVINPPGTSLPGPSIPNGEEWGDMYKRVYDTNYNGIVDNSERLAGQLAAYFLQRSNHQGTQLSTTISDFTEAVQDAIAQALVNSPTVQWIYNDAGDTIQANSTPNNTLVSLKEEFTINNDSYYVIPTGLYVKRVLIKSTLAIPLFRLGTTSLGEELISDTPARANTWEKFQTDYYSEGAPVYFSGINSITNVIIYFD